MLQNNIHWHCAEAETELANQMDKLNEKRAQLQQVTDKLQGCIFIPDTCVLSYYLYIYKTVFEVYANVYVCLLVCARSHCLSVYTRVSKKCIHVCVYV